MSKGDKLFCLLLHMYGVVGLNECLLNEEGCIEMPNVPL